MGNLVQKIAENLIFVGEFLLIVFLCFFVAYVIEKRIQRRRGQKERILSTRKMACGCAHAVRSAGAVRTALL